MALFLFSAPKGETKISSQGASPSNQITLMLTESKPRGALLCSAELKLLITVLPGNLIEFEICEYSTSPDRLSFQMVKTS